MNSTDDLIQRNATQRLFSGDHTLWAPEPTEISNRLGWLTEPDAMLLQLDELAHFSERVDAAKIDRVVWCGMGGSSLFPELLATSQLRRSHELKMLVLDSSHPKAVLAAHAFADEGNTLFVLASKSGGTMETRSHLEYFLEHFGERAHFAAVTDAGSALDESSRQHNFFNVFNANSNIGGRYSALSHFGLVAATLLDIDVETMLIGAQQMIESCRRNPTDNPGLHLGAFMGASAVEGNDKLVLECAPSFGAWLEQLIAESTGKHGKGILPIPGDASDANGNAHGNAQGNDRVRVSYGNGGDLDLGTHNITGDAATLGAEIVRWEIATALAGAVLQINPFDQPDVESAKIAAGKALTGTLPNIATVTIEEAIERRGNTQYLVLQAFVDPAGAIASQLGDSRLTLRDETGLAATAAVGPRYLHSTGQFHKGGPRTGCSLQTLDSDLPVVGVPGRDFTFGQLITAQAAGDYQALVNAGHTVFRVENFSQ